MTLGWRINAFCCAFCCGWIVFAALFQRSDDLICFESLRLVAGLVGVLALLVALYVRNDGWRKMCSLLRDLDCTVKNADAVAHNGDAEAASASAPASPVSEPSPIEKSEARRMTEAEEQAALEAMTAEGAWEAAKAMTTAIVPNRSAEGRYYSLLRHAADLGHYEARVGLGGLAYGRGCLVEAAYWEAMAQLCGCDKDELRMRMYVNCWLQQECPDERERIRPGFSPAQSSIGRSVLRYYSGVDVPLALTRFAEMARTGDEEAAALLKYFGVEMGANGK